MNRTVTRVVFAYLVLTVLAGCRTSPIHNVNDAAITTASGKELTMEQVKKAIILAGTSLKWAMADAAPGLIVGTLNIRRHQAVVDIKYDTKKYSITYNNSMNLKYDADHKRIHSNYNGWIQNLNNAIKARLSAAGS